MAAGTLSGAVLLTREPREAAIYYEWLLDRSRGSRPGAGLREMGIGHVGAPDAHDESARGWIPVFAVDSLEAALDRVRDRDVQVRSESVGESSVRFAVNSSGLWTGLVPVDGVTPGAPASDFMNCDYSALDVEVASRTLAALLGVDSCEIIDDPFAMHILHADRRITTGVLQLSGIEAFAARPYWVTYFEVSDIEQATFKAVESGSRTLIPPTPSPFNRYAIFRDPWGNVFGLSQLDTSLVGEQVRVLTEAGDTMTLTDLVDLHLN